MVHHRCYGIKVDNFEISVPTYRQIITFECLRHMFLFVIPYVKNNNIKGRLTLFQVYDVYWFMRNKQICMGFTFDMRLNQ